MEEGSDQKLDLYCRPPDKSVYWKTYLHYFSSKTYVVGTQKNNLNETVLLSMQNTLKSIGKKIIAIHSKKIA